MTRLRPWWSVLGVCVIALGAVSPALAGPRAAKRNIIQVAREAGNFTTLLAAIDAADLTGVLSGQGKGPFTVFAPTDEAFARLPAGTVESLLQNPEALRQILLFHVVPGDYQAAEVVAASALVSAQGGSLTITTAGGVKVNGVNVVATDIQARNGVIHVIDAVLLPPQ
jgi:uncharacterized surface protein with fasciclin (FAS1) repeats